VNPKLPSLPMSKHIGGLGIAGVSGGRTIGDGGRNRGYVPASSHTRRGYPLNSSSSFQHMMTFPSSNRPSDVFLKRPLLPCSSP